MNSEVKCARDTSGNLKRVGGIKAQRLSAQRYGSVFGVIQQHHYVGAISNRKVKDEERTQVSVSNSLGKAPWTKTKSALRLNK